MPVARFHVGDRVRARLATPRIRTGMVGTVREVFLPMNNLYLVRFDDLPSIELATDEILEPEDGTPDPPTE